MGFLTGKTAIITGGGRAVLSDGSCGSIGYGIATAYAKEGANLVLTGRNVKKLEDAKEELERLYGISVLAGSGRRASLVLTMQPSFKQRRRSRPLLRSEAIDVLIKQCSKSFTASGVSVGRAYHRSVRSGTVCSSGSVCSTCHYMQACYPYLKETKGSVD